MHPRKLKGLTAPLRMPASHVSVPTPKSRITQPFGSFVLMPAYGRGRTCRQQWKTYLFFISSKIHSVVLLSLCMRCTRTIPEVIMPAVFDSSRTTSNHPRSRISVRYRGKCNRNDTYPHQTSLTHCCRDNMASSVYHNRRTAVHRSTSAKGAVRY